MAIKPLQIERAPTLAEQVAERLIGAITELELAPGQRLKIDSLCGMLGVSKTPLREALPRLILDGLIEELPAGSIQVSRITAQHVREVYQARAGLEATAAWLSCARIDPQSLVQLAGRFRQIEPEIAKGEFSGYFQVDRDFHAMVVDSSGNEFLIQLVRRIASHIERIRNFSRQRPGSQVFASHQEHQAIWSALEPGDRDLARILMWDHLVQAGERIAQLVERSTNSGEGHRRVEAKSECAG